MPLSLEPLDETLVFTVSSVDRSETLHGTEDVDWRPGYAKLSHPGHETSTSVSKLPTTTTQHSHSQKALTYTSSVEICRFKEIIELLKPTKGPLRSR